MCKLKMGINIIIYEWNADEADWVDGRGFIFIKSRMGRPNIAPEFIPGKNVEMNPNPVGMAHIEL